MKANSLLVLLLSSTLCIACTDTDIGPDDDQQGPGGKADGDGTTTNPEPESASATAVVEGCGPSSQTFSPDWEALTVLFDTAWASADGETDPVTLDCNVTITYQYTPGWHFRLPSVDARWYHAVDEGSRVDLAVSARLDGGAWSDQRASIDGEYWDDRIDSLIVDEGPYSSCDGSARIEQRVTMTYTGTGFSALDSLDSEIDWERCP
jgi:hypothetical protein